MDPRREKPAAQNADLQDAVLDDARERAADLRAHDEQQSPDGPDSGESITPPHGDPQQVRVDVEAAVRAEQHSMGILGELDGGGVRFEPPGAETETAEPAKPAEPVDPPPTANATTADQVRNMENEGQAQEQAADDETPADPSAGRG